MKVMKAVKSPLSTETKAYRDVKHNFVVIVGEKVKGWKKVVDIKATKHVVCGLASLG